MDKKYIIVGGIAGGTGAAMRLRRLDERAKITLFEQGQSVNFAGYGLPYYIGGLVKNSDELIMQTPGSIKKKFNIDVKVNMEITGINRRERKVEVKNLATGRKYLQTYDKLILAPGSVTVKPDIPGIGSERIFTLSSIADSILISEYISKNPVRRVLIIGGGYVGLEMAESMVKRGIATYVVEASDHIFTPFDPDMSSFVAMELKKNGVLLMTGTLVTAFSESEECVIAELSNGRKMSADIVILGTGTIPEVSLAKKAGLGIGLTGGILVDERQQTTDKDIYAVGDAVEMECLSGIKELMPVASLADRQGRIAADNICGLGSRYKKTLGVMILKLFGSVFACAGVSEKRLLERKESYEKVYVRTYSHAEYYPGAVIMTVKMMFEKKTGRILGVQIAGSDGVDKRIDVFATAIRAGFTADRLCELELAYAPPFGTSKDPVNIAGCVASDIMQGLAETVHWHDIENISDSLFVDVRPKSEYEAGTIKHAVNIPINEIRERIGELPKKRNIVLFCNNGQDAYTAQRMLKQRGFTVKYLSGGYSLYEILKENRR